MRKSCHIKPTVFPTMYRLPRRATFFFKVENIFSCCFFLNTIIIMLISSHWLTKTQGDNMVPLYCSSSSSSFVTAMPKSARGRQKLNTFSIPNRSKSIHHYFTKKLWIIDRLYGALLTVRTILKLQRLALKRSKCCKIIRSKGRNKNHNRETQEHFSNVMHLKLQGMHLHGEAISLAYVQWYISLKMTGYCRCQGLIMRKNWKGQYFGPCVNSNSSITDWTWEVR